MVSKLDVRVSNIDLGLEGAHLVSRHKRSCNLKNVSHFTLFLLRLDILFHSCDLCLHAGLEGRYLIANFSLVALTGFKAFQLRLKLFDTNLSMLTVFGELPGFSAAL